MPKTYIAQCYIVLGSDNRHFNKGQLIIETDLSADDIVQLLEDGKIIEAECVDVSDPRPAPTSQPTQKRVRAPKSAVTLEA